MTELKTLKDLSDSTGPSKKIDAEDLRQEAIKRAKHHLKISNEQRDAGNYNNSAQSYGSYLEDKIFFNITEEELK